MDELRANLRLECLKLAHAVLPSAGFSTITPQDPANPDEVVAVAEKFAAFVIGSSDK